MNALIVHMGKTYPAYLTDCVEQFFLHNKTALLYCIVEKEFENLDILEKQYSNFRVVYVSSFPKSTNHKFFLKFNRNAYSTWRGGFWRYVIERFFIMEDFLKSSGEINILHFECDNLIYADISNLESYFSKLNKMAIIIDSDARCIPCVVFIPNVFAIKQFCKFYNLHYTLFPYKNCLKSNDMVAFSKYWKKKPTKCMSLPVIPPKYAKDKKILSNLKGETAKSALPYYEEFDKINYIFDAAAFGQYIGGLDTRYSDNQNENTVGFINEQAVYNPEEMPISWKKNSQNLVCPYIEYPTSNYIPIFNLHIHSKNLSKYRSDKILISEKGIL